MLSGAEVLVRGLVAHGVDTVFGIPGTHNLEIYRHLSAHRIRHVTVRHEQGAGYAADGYARTSGRPGVAVTTTGPAVLNIAAALAQAYSDSVPILVVAPGPPRGQRQRNAGTLHEMLDQYGALAAITPVAYRASSHAELSEAVAQAFVEMCSGRPRPAYLEVPLDLLAEMAEVRLADPVLVSAPVPAPHLVAAAATQLVSARRPALLLGGGARGAAAPARWLAEALAMPVLTTTNGKGILPEDHPLSVSASLHLAAASRVVEECDVLLAVGTELADTDWWNGRPTPQALIRVDVDPAQLVVNARPTLAVHADAALALEALRAAVTGLFPDHAPADPAWATRWRSIASTQARQEGARWVSTMDAIASVLGRDAFVMADNAMACYYGALGCLPAYRPGGFCFPTGFGTLGFAVPAGIGAAIAHPGCPVVALVGDGGVMFSVQELATAAAHDICLPVVVFVNEGYGEIRAQMRDAGIEPLAVDLPVPDFVGLARALGGHGVVCASPDQLAGELRSALGRAGPTLLVVAEPTAAPAGGANLPAEVAR